ncbi:MAG TPA: hypothetical protein PJ986_21390 [Gammaproteobacteria bacterium]|nr:hypothetical protein [Gammaproteobacteria bacterium]
MGESERVCGALERGVAPLERRQDLELAAAGWQRRHSVEPARAAESAEIYRALGFEVLTRAPLPRDFDPACGACAQRACDGLLVIYTRTPRDTESQSSPP